ncbi:MAG TPA: hypothetical protein VFJ05_00510, partial [Nitrososphaeraceae archaeon]|nr:hypothetical protein [Nitrososphaeraceae archaeon]
MVSFHFETVTVLFQPIRETQYQLTIDEKNNHVINLAKCGVGNSVLTSTSPMMYVPFVDHSWIMA